MARPYVAYEQVRVIARGLKRGERMEEIAGSAGVSESTVRRFKTAQHPLSPRNPFRRRYSRFGRVSIVHRDGSVTIRLRRALLDRMEQHADLLVPGM